MSLREKIDITTTPGGEINEISWKQSALHAMLRPQRSLVRIPSPRWKKLIFPFNLQEEIINHSAARVTFQIFVPAYRHFTDENIGNGLQKIAYDVDQQAVPHQKAALRSLIKNIAASSPQFQLDGDLISISGYEPAYRQAVRFTRWSTFPCEFLQARVLWDDWSDPEQRVIETEIALLFDQRKTKSSPFLQVDKRGIINLELGDWVPDFDLEQIQAEEVPQLEAIRTPPINISLSSEDNTPSPAPKEPPRKRIRLTRRFVISSDEEN